MIATFETKLNDLVLLSADWRTNTLFIGEAQKLTEEVSTMACMNADPVELMSCLGGLQGVLASQEKWLQTQLSVACDPNASKTTDVQWVM